MIPYKDIGNNLTVSEFNGVISLLRDNITFKENIQINTSKVTGAYGEYIFNFNEATVLDNGILITNETLSTVGTVKLTNPIFPHSNYILEMKVYSTEDIGISGMNHKDIIVTNLSIPLLTDMEVDIPFKTLDMNNIVGFDANIVIRHNDLIIAGANHITLSSDRSVVGWDENVIVTARCIDENGDVISNVDINFYEGETLLDTITTDEQGYASITCSWEDMGVHTVLATYESTISNKLAVTVGKHTPQLVLSANRDYGIENIDITLTGTLKDDDTPLESVISLYNGNTFIKTVTTDGNGEFTTNITCADSNMSIIAISEEQELYSQTTSNNILIDILTDYTEVTFTGKEFSKSNTGYDAFGSDGDVFIDYGDGTIEVNKKYNHTYAQTGTYTIKIYNATELISYCFNGKQGVTKVKIGNGVKYIGQFSIANSGVTSIEIPSSVISLASHCFRDNRNLLEIKLNWTSASEINRIGGDSSRIDGCSSFDHYLIPKGLRSIYSPKFNPLREDVEIARINISASKPATDISENNTLTATVYDSDGDVAQNYPVTFFDGETNLGTVKTNANGIATKTFSSNVQGNHNITAECMNIISETIQVSVLDWNDSITLQVTGNQFTAGTYHRVTSLFEYTGRIFVNWGDNTVTEYITGVFSHTYANAGNYTIKICGNITKINQFAFYEVSNLVNLNISQTVTDIDVYAFRGCSNLNRIDIPSSVQNIGVFCFIECASLQRVDLYWEDESSIVEYPSLTYPELQEHFMIPDGTFDDYYHKGYPAEKLIER